MSVIISSLSKSFKVSLQVIQLWLNCTVAMHLPNLKPPSFPFHFTQIFWFSAPAIQSPAPPNLTTNLIYREPIIHSPSVIYSPPTTSPFMPLSEVIATQRITPTWGWTHRRIKRSPLLLHRPPWGTLGNHRKKGILESEWSVFHCGRVKPRFVKA